MNKGLLSCKDAAAYLLFKSDGESADISNLKLQKLLYYAQGYSLALHDRPLFKNPIAAWPHGPVVEEIYNIYKKYEGNPIPRPKALDVSRMSPENRELLDIVYADYGQYSAWKLRNLSHMEPPYRSAIKSGDGRISLNGMSSHFKQQLSIKSKVDADELRKISISFDELIASVR